MGLFSIFRKNKQEPVSGDGEFYSRAEEESALVRGRGKRKDNQSNEPVDPVLPEKKRARRRLVGAVALVLAAIIGLPMIFDSEPKPVAEDIAIQIPSKDKSAIHGLGTATPSASPVALVTAKEEPVAAPNGSVTSSTSAVATTLTAMPTDKSPEKIAEPVKSDEKRLAKPATKTESNPDLKSEPKKTIAKVEPKTESKSPDAKKTALTPTSTTAPKPARDKKAGKFAVQVAALSTQEKINELLAKLKKAGFTTGTQKVATESGSSTRIRVGPYASREEAEKAVAKLNKMGLTNSKLVPLSH